MTEQDVYDSALFFTTQRYGPLYIVSGSHARGRTFYAYLLDTGQELTPNLRIGPNNRHPSLRDDQEIFGVVAGQRGWSEQYGWIKSHPSVQNETASTLLIQLVEANNHAMSLGMLDPRVRQEWLHVWAIQHLGASLFDVSLPDLNSP